MIPQTKAKRQLSHWQNALKQCITNPKELLSRLNLPLSLASDVYDLNFPCRVPLEFVNLMEKENPHDPLLKQVLPTPQEKTVALTTNTDPLQENQKNPIPGLLHKYHGRILLTLTKHCAIHCRYCFRRDFDYANNQPSKDNWENVIAYLTQNPDIYEVILSGGDPLTAPDHYLAKLIQKLEQIPHIKILRIHTRLGVVIPSRLCPEFFSLLENTRLKTVLVFHCNHPNEISEEFSDQVFQLKAQLPHITCLNQSVLLKGVNDNAQPLITLCHKLFEVGILPYYVHALDPFPGTQHFQISQSKTSELHKALLATLPGYLVPRFVQETPNYPSKVPIF